MSYGLITESTVKEGKSAYKKMEQITQDKTFEDFLNKYKSNFPIYGKHKTEYWLLNTLKNTCSDESHQPSELLYMVSDFAQNLKLDKKKEISEEYFHKKQIAIFATVSTINRKISENEKRQHTVSQITSSENK